MTVENDVNLISEETRCHCEKKWSTIPRLCEKSNAEREKKGERERRKREGDSIDRYMIANG